MNCREFQKRLAQLEAENRPLDDAALLAHIESCQACAAEYERAVRLRDVLNAASADDTESLKPLAAHRVEVAARLAHRAEEMRPRRFRRYALGVVTAAVLIATTLLLPGRNGKVIGYDLAVDGVSVDLAGDHDRLCDMLFALGAVDAGVDIGACDTSCRVVIFDLRTKDEAELVGAAIKNLNPGKVTFDVIPVRHPAI